MDRFYSKIDTSGDCHEWTAYKSKKGYGQFGYEGRVQNAHRVALMLTGADIPSGMCVCHTCDNPGCVNPDHLWLGTNEDNHNDKIAKGRQYRGEGHYSTPFCEADIVLIRDLAKGNLTQQVIADWFGVTNQSINSIICNKTWKHV